MKAETWVRVRQIFEGAVGLPEGERAEYVDGACGANAELRGEVERLLEEDRSAAGFLDPLAPPPPSRSLAPGNRIGPYEIRRVLASGGMGTVYEAVQDQPRRPVALKTLRHGLGSPSRRQRFAFEAEVLGNLRHPGIAQIYASGTYEEDGRSCPYFAMEFVEGACDLLTFADERRLSVDERVDLFLGVCDAVQHGHSKGVVHRDLKPGNVLVDPDGRAVIIDFGIARATAPELAAAAAETQEGQLVGTLPYTSPEQLTTGDVDTRSDVYSLGVILYELLTGSQPHALDGLPLRRAVQVVCDEPPRPARGLSDELGWILATALAKDPDRRYASAAELAADLRRFRAHEPVAAGAPGAVYRLRKLARRHRALLGGAAAAVVALSLGLVRAQANARAAERALAQARLEAAKANGVSAFLRRALTSVSPFREGEDVRVVDVLASSSADLASGALAPSADVRAVVQSVIASGYSALGLHAEAAPHLAAVEAYVAEHVAPEDRFAIEVAQARAHWHYDMGRPADAVRTARETDVVAGRALAADDPLRLEVRELLAKSLAALGSLDEATAIYDELLATCGDEPQPFRLEYADLLRGRSDVCMQAARFEEARELREAELEYVRAGLGPDHYRTWTAVNGLGYACLRTEELERCEELFRAYADYARSRFQGAHPAVFTAANNHGIALMRLGRLEEAAPLLDEAWELASELYGAESLNTLTAQLNRANIYWKTGDPERTEEICRASLELCPRVVPEHHAIPMRFRLNLARSFSERDRWKEAEAELREGLELAREGPEQSITRFFASRLTYILQQQEELEEALPFAEESVALCDPGTESRRAAEETLAEIRAALGRSAAPRER